MKLTYCITNEGWFDMKVSSIKQATAEIRLLMFNDKKVQEFYITTDNESRILFIVEGKRFWLSDC